MRKLLLLLVLLLACAPPETVVGGWSVLGADSALFFREDGTGYCGGRQAKKISSYYPEDRLEKASWGTVDFRYRVEGPVVTLEFEGGVEVEGRLSEQGSSLMVLDQEYHRASESSDHATVGQPTRVKHHQQKRAGHRGDEEAPLRIEADQQSRAHRDRASEQSFHCLFISLCNSDSLGRRISRRRSGPSLASVSLASRAGSPYSPENKAPLRTVNESRKVRVLSRPKAEIVAALNRSSKPHATKAADFFQKMPEETIGEALWTNQKELMKSRKRQAVTMTGGMLLAGGCIGAVLAKAHPGIYLTGMVGTMTLLVMANASVDNRRENRFLNYWAGELAPQFQDSAAEADWLKEASSEKVTTVGRKDLVALLGKISDKLPADHSAREQLDFELNLLRKAPGETLEEVRSLSLERSPRETGCRGQGVGRGYPGCLPGVWLWRPLLLDLPPLVTPAAIMAMTVECFLSSRLPGSTRIPRRPPFGPPWIVISEQLASSQEMLQSGPGRRHRLRT